MIFAAAGKHYECGFSHNATLKENLAMLYTLVGDDLKKVYIPDGNEQIYDAYSGTALDPDVSLSSNGIRDGAALMVC